jgi:hypothetical protein
MTTAKSYTTIGDATVHLAAGIAAIQRRRWTPRLLSFASGISVSHVFLDLLPDLSRRQATIDALGVLTLLDRHVYTLAPVGLIIAFCVETASRASRRHRRLSDGPDHTELAVYRLSIATFVIQNGAIGYAVGSLGDQAVEPLWLFAVALGLHFVVNDHALVEHHGTAIKPRGVGGWWALC